MKRKVTVLVVEDDHSVRDVVRRMLESDGFAVLCAEHGEEALVRASAHRGRIDLVITDVVMPCMGGAMLAEVLSLSRPGARVLYMSGYPTSVLERNGFFPLPGTFISKPFTCKALLASIRAALSIRLQVAPAILDDRPAQAQ